MLSIDPIFLVLFTTGLSVGFGHCLGMCGPIVVSLSLNLKGKKLLLPQFLYHAGRVTTYSFLGGIMGITGSFTMVASNIASLQKSAMILAGVMIMVMGFAMTGWVPLGKLFGDYSSLQGFLSKGFRTLSASRSVISYYPIGLLLGLLPCGPIYTALLASARSGMEIKSVGLGFLAGSVQMFAFGLGTVPALMVMAKLVDFGWFRWRDRVYKMGSFLMILVGVYFIIKGIRY